MIALPKTMQNVFLFYLENSFRSQDIQVFVVFFPFFRHFLDSKGQMEVE